MAPITRTCSLLLAGAALIAFPAVAEARVFVRSSASTFVAARAAAEAGEARRAAILYASLMAAEPGNRMIAGRALSQAILAGDMPLALRLARARPRNDLGPDAQLLLVADALRNGADDPAALAGDLGFVLPFVEAWRAGERRRWQQAVAVLDRVAPDNVLAALVPEHKALILLAAGRTREAQPLIPAALERAGGRGDRLRIAFAAGLSRAGDGNAAAALLAGRDVTLVAARRSPGPMISTAAQGYAELLLGLALTLQQGDDRALPLAIVQAARHADPANAQGAVLLGLLLGQAGRGDDALAVLRGVDERSLFLSEARDAEIRILLRDDRRDEARARAAAFVDGPGVTADDWTRLGDVHDAMDRHGEAAAAFARAIALVAAGGAGSELWSLHLMHGAALEQADRWPQAEAALEQAYRLAPDNPVVLNYLGYARLERGEQLDEAEALIGRASALAPDDASITDSLGWAQYKRGKVGAAVLTLQRAAAADPGQAEIHEHLGDALYAAGRKYEARFAWNAALVAAEDDVRKRVETKLATGLSPATAAP